MTTTETAQHAEPLAERLHRRELLEQYLGAEAVRRTAARTFEPHDDSGYVCADGLCAMASLIRDAGKLPASPMPVTGLAFVEITGRTYDHNSAPDVELMQAIERLIWLNDSGRLATPELVRYHFGLED